MANSFHFGLGQRARAELTRSGGEQRPPRGMTEVQANQWQAGYGGHGERVGSFGTEVRRGNPPNRRDGETIQEQGRTILPAPPPVLPPVLPPVKVTQATLFEMPAEPEAPVSAPKAQKKEPMPIPQDEREDELGLLVSVGIGVATALRLIDADWTLDQLVCQTLVPADTLPVFVSDVLPLVLRHRESRYPCQSDDRLKTEFHSKSIHTQGGV